MTSRRPLALALIALTLASCDRSDTSLVGQSYSATITGIEVTRDSDGEVLTIDNLPVESVTVTVIDE